MNVNYMREHVKQRYKGPTWATKVKNMSDEQVIAIYRSMFIATNSIYGIKPREIPTHNQNNMSMDINKFYNTCSRCGANNDPGERCDCDG